MDVFVELAKNTIKEYLEKNRLPDTKNLPPELKEKRAGCFVSLHTKEGELRGCVGTILPVYKNLAGEIISNAIAACQDGRFPKVTKKEVTNINPKVDILSEPEEIANKNFLDPKKYGVIVKSQDGRTGLLLPNLKEIDSANQQITIARQKAGILEEEPICLYRFTTERHEG